MATKIPKPAGGAVAPQQRPLRAQKAEKKQSTSKVAERAQVVDSHGVDPHSLAGQTIAGVTSPLTAVMWSGIELLARSNGYNGQGQADPLSMLMSALGSSEKPEDALSKESRDASRRQFVSVGFEREKAGELVNLLAFVVAGMYTDPTHKKRSRENVIQHEIDNIRAGITDIKKTPYPEREEKLAKVLGELFSFADDINKRTEGLQGKELPEPLKVAVERMRAVFAITSIISSHVLPAKS
jgi:hypothetical protein